MTGGYLVATTPEIGDYQHQVTAIERDVQDVAGGLIVAELNWRPAQTGWSIGECIEHLNLMGRCFLRAIETAIDEAFAQSWRDSGPFHYGRFETWWVRQVEPEAKIRFNTPKPFIPAPGIYDRTAVEEFLMIQRELLDLRDRADGIDLTKPKVRLPSPRFLKLSLGQTFALVLAHERRHLWQAWEVREKLELP